MTAIYVDSSALLKRVFVEDGSALVRSVLRERNAAGELIAASELAWVEVSRALLRARIADHAAQLSAACSGVARHPVDSAVLMRARTVGTVDLRTPDAIHIAAALGLGADEILTFDLRLASAAEALGFRVICVS